MLADIKEQMEEQQARLDHDWEWAVKDTRLSTAEAFGGT